MKMVKQKKIKTNSDKAADNILKYKESIFKV